MHCFGENSPSMQNLTHSARFSSADWQEQRSNVMVIAMILFIEKFSVADNSAPAFVKFLRGHGFEHLLDVVFHRRAAFAQLCQWAALLALFGFEKFHEDEPTALAAQNAATFGSFQGALGDGNDYRVAFVSASAGRDRHVKFVADEPDGEAVRRLRIGFIHLRCPIGFISVIIAA